ncbi:MAG: hypothetical protein EXQ64_00730 [Ilumatobacteraceae bacterium]|nr:hypothetical protein [Ilumatobacteraceae bacterium]
MNWGNHAGYRVGNIALLTGVWAIGVLGLSGCSKSSAQTNLILRGVDEIQVMSPAQVAALRRPVSSTIAQDATGQSSNTGSADTVPLNVDNRAPEVKLFAAYQKFNSCLKSDGFKIEGNLQDPKNPAFQNKEYVASLTKCAARSDILNVLRATQEATAKLTPEEVKGRNTVFKALSECLKKRGWTVELTVSDVGLLQPKQFASADGTLNERDLDQCLTETGVNTSDPGGP